MSHLTTVQILQAVDGTADPATQAMVANHAAVCSLCRKEVDLQRSLLRIARKMPPAAVSEKFTQKVMSRVVPRQQSQLAQWVLNNMGNVFGMMVVLGVVWYVVDNPQAFVPASQPTPEPAFVKEWKDGMETSYEALKGFLVRSVGVQQKASQNGSGNLATLTLTILLSIGVLVLGDKLVSGRFLDPKRRN